MTNVVLFYTLKKEPHRLPPACQTLKDEMKKKLRIGILFGGRSGEHEVSLLSAASILKAIDKTKYEIVPIGITKQGRWITSTDAQHLLTGEAKPIPSKKSNNPGKLFD